MRSVPEPGHASARATGAWWRWRNAATTTERERATLDLWLACDYLVWAAAGKIAGKVGMTVPQWTARHGWDADDLRHEAFAPVMRAAKTYRPDRGAAFPTHAFPRVLYRLAALARLAGRDALAGASEAPPFTEASHGSASETGASEAPPDLWHLLELPTWEVGPKLAHLSPHELRKLRAWCDEVKDRALAAYPPVRWGYLRFYCGVAALPPEVLRQPIHEGTVGVGPLRGMAVRADGKAWDLMLPVGAAMLRDSPLSERAAARRLGMAQTSYRALVERVEVAGFDPRRFGPDAAARVAVGQKRGPKQDS